MNFRELSMDYIHVLKSKCKSLSKLKKYSFDERYIATDTGRIYLIKRIEKNTYMCKALKPYIDRQGYVEYVLTDTRGIKKHLLIHRVVAELFIPNRNTAKTQVNHIDGNKQNNDVRNLEWLTPSENIIHMHRMYKEKREKEK